MTTYLGLDVHARRTVFVAQDDRGRVIARGDVNTSREGFEELSRNLGGEIGIKAGLESGTQSFWACDELTRLGFHPYVINAAEVRAKAIRPNQKSDRRDAFEICDGLRRDLYVSRVYVPSSATRKLRTLVTRRRFFVRMLTAQVNSAKAVLRSEGVKASSKITTASAWKILIDGCPDSFLRGVVRMHFRVWKQAACEVERLDKLIGKESAECFPGVSTLLRTAPGVGPVVSATFMSVIGDPKRFESGGQVVSYLGLCPSTWDSGDRTHHGRITKRGSSEARSMLVEAAQHAGDPRHPLHPYYARVASRQGHNKAKVCVAQRLARILWRMWLHGEKFDVGKLNVSPVVRVRTRKYYWQLQAAV